MSDGSELAKLKVDYIIDYDQNSSLSNAKLFGNDTNPGDNVFLHYNPTTNPQKLFARMVPNTISTGSDIQIDEIAANISEQLEITPSKLVPQMPTTWFNENKPDAGQEHSFYVKVTNELLNPSPSVGILYNYIPPPVPPEGYTDIIYGDQTRSESTFDALNHKGHLNYYNEFNYSVLFIEADRLPEFDCNITSFNFQVKNEYANIYDSEKEITVYMANVPTDINQLPDLGTSFKLDLTTNTDATWNSKVTPELMGSNIVTFYQQTSSDPSINWKPNLILPTPFPYKTGNNLVISINSRSGEYDPGSQNATFWLGGRLSGSNQLNHWAVDQGLNPYPDIFKGLHYDNTFRPNIRVNWTTT